MKLFIDASALVALLALEEGFEVLGEKLDQADQRITSPIAPWEATIALSKSCGIMLDFAIRDVQAFISARGVSVVSVGEIEGAVALTAQRRYGKGRHRARLNMGDCFAYACAKTNGAKLLYKGDDFVHTDMA
jgi:ribonuclease VapC